MGRWTRGISKGALWAGAFVCLAGSVAGCGDVPEAAEPDGVTTAMSPLVSTRVTPTPPDGRSGWSPFTPRPVKRITWRMRKNYNSARAFVGDGYGTDYSSRGSNAFILNEIKKVLVTWSGVADLEFAYVEGGTADLVFAMEPTPALPGEGGIFRHGQEVVAVDSVPDFASFPEDAPTSNGADPGPSPYRTATRDGNTYLYATLLHEVGHALGYDHAWTDHWDYRYDYPQDDGSNPQNSNNCNTGGPCRYPLEKNAPDFSIMDYRNGDRQGRHPRGRVLTDYDVYYARAMYGRPNWVPLLETKQNSASIPESYVADWDSASSVLDQYSYLKYVTNDQSLGGRETSAAVSALLGVIRPQGTQDATWKTLYVYYNPYGVHLTLATDATIPSGWQPYSNLGRLRTSSGEGYTQPIYRHRMASDYRVTKSSTPPTGFVYDVLLGYTKPDAGVTMDTTPRLNDDGGSYQLTSVLTGKPVGTNQSSTSNGTLVVNNPPSRASGPWWRFVGAGDGVFRVVDTESGRVLDTVGSSTADGVTMNVWDYVGLPEQEWSLNATSTPGVYTLAIRQSGKCLTVPSNTTGAQLTQVACNGSTNQQFKLAKRSMAFRASDWFYKIVARHSGKVIDVSAASTADGAVIQQWTWNAGNNQRWRVDGSMLAAKHSARNVGGDNIVSVLEVAGASNTDGAYIQQDTAFKPGVNTQYQAWDLNFNSSGYVQIKSWGSGKCLAVQNSSTADGARLQQVTCNSTALNQQFDFQRVE